MNDDTPFTDAGAVTPISFHAICLSRRSLLSGAVYGLAAITLGAVPVAHAISNATEDSLANFLRVSAFLTGRQSLNPVLATLIFSEMKEDDLSFAEQVAELASVIEQPSMQWRQTVQATAKKITSVWYTGLIGDGDDLRVITYEGALQFAATQDIFIVRSYCPNRPGFWASQPAGWRV